MYFIFLKFALEIHLLWDNLYLETLKQNYYTQCYQSRDFGARLGYFWLSLRYLKSSTATSLLLGYFVIPDREFPFKSGAFVENSSKKILKCFYSISLALQKETIGNLINEESRN